jgi:NADH:ubiquinone oxidoreductase subunit H
MEPLILLFSVLLAASATMFLWLSIVDRRASAAVVERAGPSVALDDLVGARHPLFPHTIRQTPLD